MIEIYTDGSCWPNDGTGNGTFGFVVVQKDEAIHEYIDGRKETTNNKMEMLGLITALKFAIEKYKDQDVTIYCDSQYTVKGYNIWSHNWFGGKGKNDLKNRDMWEYMHKLRSPNVKVKWVKGHDVSKWNNHVDGMCNEEFIKRYGFRPKK